MAYYPWDSAHEPVEPVTPAAGSVPSGIGAYYAWDSAHEPVMPVNGLSGSAEAKISDEALRALIDHKPPVAVVGDWALQATDLNWLESKHESAFTLLPLTDRELNRARRGAFGAEAAVVGVLMKTPMPLAAQARAFAGTPYQPVLPLAVYSLTDTRPVALPRFLTIAALRDIMAPDRGTGSVEAAARALGGELVYVISLPKEAQQRAPGATFQEVFRAIGATPPAVTPPPAAPAASASLGLYFLGGVLAVGGAWWALSRWEHP